MYKPVSKKVFCADCAVKNECEKEDEQIEKCMEEATLYRNFCEIK